MTKVAKRLSALLVAAVVATLGPLGMIDGISTSAANSSVGSVWPLLIAPAQREGLFYLLTSERCDDQRCLHLYRTRDDVNRTWDAPLRLAQVKMPPYERLARTPQGTVMAMVFTTPNVGYILEGNSEAQELYVTTNGARSWQRSPTPQGDTIWGLTATSTHVYALFAHSSSTKNGSSFLELANAPLRATYWRGEKIPFGQFVEQPLGQMTGYGEMAMFAETSREGERIYVSHNGGRSFVSSTHANLKSSTGCTLSAEDVQRVWAVCTTKSRVTLHLTDDSGSSWNVFVRQPHNIEPGGIVALTNTHDFGYAYTGAARRNIVRLNFGANREHVVGTLGCRSVASITFMDVDHGYAICNLANGVTALDRTTNGGESWGRIAITPSNHEGVRSS